MNLILFFQPTKPLALSVRGFNLGVNMLKDICYILKPDIKPDELTYSLRSVEANFPHRYVWFVGGQPEGFTPDRRIVHQQTGSDKWSKIRSSLYRAIENEELSDEFFLFNDDFFVMKPVTGKFVNFANGTLPELVEKLRPLNPWLTPYARTVAKVISKCICLCS